MSNELKLEESTREDERESVKQLIFRILGFVFITAALLLAIYGIVALSAWRQGQDQRAERADAVLEEDLNNQLLLAEEDISASNFRLALRRLEWVLSRDPDYPGAQELHEDTQKLLNLQLTPSPTASPSATPELIEVEIGANPVEPFTELQDLAEIGDWRALSTALPEFQSSFPNYRRQETDKMLYEAYIELGKEMVVGEQVELGLFYFSQAEKLGDLPADVEDLRSWAELYLTGIGFFGVNWDATLLYFRDLCAAAPFYQGACEKFRQALAAYADQYSESLDWCPAEALYREAIVLNSSAELANALDEAVKGCSEATPTPTATVEGEEVQENTPTPESE